MRQTKKRTDTATASGVSQVSKIPFANEPRWKTMLLMTANISPAFFFPRPPPRGHELQEHIRPVVGLRCHPIELRNRFAGDPVPFAAVVIVSAQPGILAVGQFHEEFLVRRSAHTAQIAAQLLAASFRFIP